ncbi:prepilin-type N-terminal cleavage/methylation domain-containing protein [Pulveribacter sp.]|uniref:pilin n=1 Tax=Pulveribacter sp. TaxID=2678893 RepID=UPI0028995CEE|nr:prepilin-type N-terminal cleavage/methylation domain-containing protein [Pulveribacter sp.]
MKKRIQTGFTLLELMIAVAITGVLAAISLPAYQVYTKRTRVSEGLLQATSAKQNVADIFFKGSMHSDPEGYGASYVPSTISSNVLGPTTAPGIDYKNSSTPLGGAIRIDPQSREISIPYTLQIASVGNNIMVLTPYIGDSGTPIPLPDGTSTSASQVDGLKWLCRAAGATSLGRLPAAIAPTLPPKLAPADCR